MKELTMLSPDEITKLEKLPAKPIQTHRHLYQDLVDRGYVRAKQDFSGYVLTEAGTLVLNVTNDLIALRAEQNNDLLRN